jgi:hypothetical protein
MSCNLVPPHIVAHSPEQMPITIREGRDVRFSCRAVGRPTPDVTWHVNGILKNGTVTTSRHISLFVGTQQYPIRCLF